MSARWGKIEQGTATLRASGPAALKEVKLQVQDHANTRLEVRFWAKVDRDGPVPSHCPELGPCWVWTASTFKDGYGQITIRPPKRSRKAHQVAWELAHGPIPESMCVLHRCDNRPCVRLDHLFLGTIGANNRDMWAKGRSNFQLRPDDRAKLTRDQAAAIATRYAAGETNKVNLACEFGISSRAVWNIVNGRAWVAGGTTDDCRREHGL